MKRILLVLLALISINTFAQINVKEGSFRKIDGYLMLDKEDHRDDNWKPMALIKITAEGMKAEERARLEFHGNMSTYVDVKQMGSQTYLYLTAQAATFLEIIHPDYGKTEYWFPEDLCDYCGYEMVVQYVPIVPVSNEPAKIPKTYLIVKTDQPEALIYIDDEPINTGEASKSVNIGTTHTYKIECDLYHTETGTVTVNDRVTIDKKLRPNHGYINVTTTPEQGAKVYVDGKYLGVSPIKTDKLASGSHTVRVMKDMYKMKEQSFIVNDGQTTNAALKMSANFVNVTISTDSQSNIYVDEEYKGTGRWTGRLSDGSHIFEARKSNHRTSVKSMDLVLGETNTITLDAPQPINGDIDINTSPMGATIYIDGKNYGETPNYISDILIGEHELKLTKQGCAEVKKTIIIREGETLTINEKLRQQTTDNGQQSSGKQQVAKRPNQTITVNGVSFTMIAVEGGTFQMGATSEQGSDAYSDEKPVHNVTLSDYYIGETEVTQELWQAVMGSNPSSFSGYPQRPVECVSWNDCQEFITKLNNLTGKNFRLPTEAEWEYAARGGNKSQGYKYSGSNRIRNVAWYWDNSSRTTHDVKTKAANEIGIYDMSGNVWEWCQDWYGNYSSSSQTNPAGPSSGSYRVLRGGGWYDRAGSCRVSNRLNCCPDDRFSDHGFRLVL